MLNKIEPVMVVVNDNKKKQTNKNVMTRLTSYI